MTTATEQSAKITSFFGSGWHAGKACRKKLVITFCLLSIVGWKVIARTEDQQKDHPNYRAVSASYQFGHILPTTDFVRGDNLIGSPMTRYNSYTLKMLWQNPGYRDWQKVYHCPYYGAGLELGDFFNPLEVGNPVSVYGILGIPIIRVRKFELFSEFQFGVAGNWKHYDSVCNPKNLVLGGSLTVHVSGSVRAFYQLTKQIDLGAGMSFIHFSNGGFERPNKGFNIYSPSVELKYHLRNRPDYRSVPRPGRLNRSNYFFVMMGYGDYQLRERELDTTYYAVGGLSALYFTQLSNAFRLGYGTDVNYWFGMNARPHEAAGPLAFENVTIGLTIQPELILNKLTLVGGVGIYAVHKNYGNFKQMYQRLGVRYEFYKHLSLGVNVRSVNYTMAEFLEFNVGYRIR